MATNVGTISVPFPCKPIEGIDMTSRSKWILSIVPIVLVGIAGDELHGRIKEERRQASYQALLAIYSGEVPKNASRAQVEKYIRSHGAQPEHDQQPVPPAINDIVMRLGEAQSPWYCSRVVVYLKLEFDAADRYRGASLKPEAQDCM
jgi:hypothetical protein